MIGQTSSHYRIVAKLSGGMSISFKSGCRIRKALLKLEIQTRRFHLIHNTTNVQ